MSLSRLASDADLRRAESSDEKTIDRLELCKIHTCERCGDSITDEFILRLSSSSEWHTQCLNCETCGDNLSYLDSCYVKNGSPYCKRDYQRIFGKTCSGCNIKLHENDFVMKVKSHVFHPTCFRCIVCNIVLTSGDSFRFNLNGIVCKQHFDAFQEKLSTDEKEQSIYADISNNIDQQLPIENGGDLKKVKHETSLSNEIMEDNGKSTTPDACANETYKPTRIRTVLSDKQVAILKTCYTANPRPDALMKEQLVEMTGLSLRVIRVWFQNKRCKDKKKSVITIKRKFVNSYDTATLSTVDASANSSPYLQKRSENQVLINNQWASVAANQTYSRHSSIQNGSYQSYVINKSGIDGWYEKESGLQNIQHQTPSPSYSSNEALDFEPKTTSSLKPSEFFQLISFPSSENNEKHPSAFNANAPSDFSSYKSKHSHISELGWSESKEDRAHPRAAVVTSASEFYTPFQALA